MLRPRRLILPVSALLLAAGASQVALACPDCPSAQAARAAVWSDPSVWGYFALLPLPFVLVGLVQMLRRNGRPDAALISAGTLLGVGLGGFSDGILFHQILQWHNMLSSWLPPVDLITMKINMIWDGLFHAFTWTVTLIGVVRLFRAGQNKAVPWDMSTFVGAMLGGWGMFNVIEGLVDHQFLGIHHLRPGAGQLAWDLGFLLFGVLLIAVGRAMTSEPPQQPLRR